MNAKKTKAMVISINENNLRVDIKVDGTAVEQVGSLNYLGQTLSDDGRCVHEIKKRIGLANTTFSTNERRFEINKDTIEYEKKNLAMLCLVNTVVWRWDMDHNQRNEDTHRSI